MDAIKELCQTAKELGYSPTWVYHQLNTLKHAVNIPLLKAIQSLNGYKQGWLYFTKKQLEARIK